MCSSPEIIQTMTCVNAVYKTRLNEHIDLEKIAKLYPNLQTKLYVGRPTQLKITCPNNITCLLFTKGAIRIMGKGISSCDASSILFNDILPMFTIARPILEVQTMTFVGQTGFEVNLVKFANQFGNELKTFYDFDIFSALKIDKFSPISVNLFSSGKIVLCGGKCKYQAQRIISHVIYYCCCCI
jgi:TATA-box binding protein (TBP) (component of TFIID and TFIIIB)